MAVCPKTFQMRKRRLPAGAFFPSKMSGRELLQSLVALSEEISNGNYDNALYKRNSISIIRKIVILSILFQDLSSHPKTSYNTSALLFFEEMYIVLQKVKALLEDISCGSKICLLFYNRSISDSFRELTLELSTLLDIFPDHEFHHLTPDVVDILRLVRVQCARQSRCTEEEALRVEVLTLLDRIKRGIVPEYSVLKAILDRLGLKDAVSCQEEMEALEEEALRNNNNEVVLEMFGLVRYAKCVLFGASTRTNLRKKQKPEPAVSDANIPSDFRCPISLELMRDPVVVSTGHTYDRESIEPWIQSGHNTCPKTGQILSHTDMIPNLSLRNLISIWCQNHEIPFETVKDKVSPNCEAVVEATKMIVSFLVNKLSTSRSEDLDSALGVVCELREVAKTNPESRSYMGEIGAIPLLVRYLGSEIPSLQVDAVATLLNLSIEDMNRIRIMEMDGALNGFVEVLRSGATWEARGNAAAAIFSLSGIHTHRKRIGRKTRVVKGLLDLARSGPMYAKRDALIAIMNLAGDREAVGRLLEAGIIDVVNETMNVLPEETVPVMEVIVKRGGLLGVSAAFDSIRKLGALLRDCSDTTRESAAATLETICRKGGGEMVEEMARISGIERTIWEMMGSGTLRGRRKAAALSRILRRWAAGMECEKIADGHIAAAAIVNTVSS